MAPIASFTLPLLWRVHEVHHSDPDYDVSTAARFHPIEVVSVQGAYLAAVALLAPPPIAVFLSELLTVVLNLFAHANASFPRKVEKCLGIVFMTPDVHRIHHSADEADHSRNFGQTFIWWDRIFGTYLSQPRVGKGRNDYGDPWLTNQQEPQPWIHADRAIPAAKPI